MKDTKIQWHPAFVAAMGLELKQNRDDLIFEKEYKEKVSYKECASSALEI